MSAEPPAPGQPAEPSPPPAGSSAGKWIAIALVLAVVGTMGGIGYHHATRNRRRHQPGQWSGQVLYVEYCARCHGLDARGTGQTNPSLVDERVERAEFDRLLQEGGQYMPKFAKTLDAEDRERLYRYLEGLWGTPPTAPAAPASDAPPAAPPG